MKLPNFIQTYCRMKKASNLGLTCNKQYPDHEKIEITSTLSKAYPRLASYLNNSRVDLFVSLDLHKNFQPFQRGNSGSRSAYSSYWRFNNSTDFTKQPIPKFCMLKRRIRISDIQASSQKPLQSHSKTGKACDQGNLHASSNSSCNQRLHYWAPWQTTRVFFGSWLFDFARHISLLKSRQAPWCFCSSFLLKKIPPDA